jgi:preprotein translocase subunit SecG
MVLNNDLRNNIETHLKKQTAPTTTTTAPTTTTSSTSTAQASTTSNTSSTPSVYDTNDNNIYNFPLLHGGNGNVENSFSSFFKNFNLTPAVLIIFLVVVIVFVLLFTSLSSLGKNTSGDTSSTSASADSNGSNGGSKSHIITVIVIVVIVIAISFLYRKFENTTIFASIKKLFTRNPQVNLTAGKTPPLPMPPSTNPPKEVPEIKLYKEVFNIPGNNYTYSQAQSICSAYDAKLATYDELEDAYVKGAEWCNYGWSEGQMALFPTQKKTYNTLQSIKGHEHDCGRPGINGGYMANPNVR